MIARDVKNAALNTNTCSRDYWVRLYSAAIFGENYSNLSAQNVVSTSILNIYIFSNNFSC